MEGALFGSGGYTLGSLSNHPVRVALLWPGEDTLTRKTIKSRPDTYRG